MMLTVTLHAEVMRLKTINADLVAAAEAVWAAVERTDDHTEWFAPLAKLRATLARAKGEE